MAVITGADSGIGRAVAALYLNEHEDAERTKLAVDHVMVIKQVDLGRFARRG